MFNLLKGDIFSHESDVLVVPCDTNGSVSYLVAQHLKADNYPILKETLWAGDISPLECAPKSLHKYVIYAAAVTEDDGWTSANLDDVSTILNKISDFCEKNKLRTINMPLLGTGSGGLDASDVCAMIKHDTNKSNLVFNVFSYSADIFNKLIDDLSQNKVNNPRVFISYAHDNEENSKWTKELADKLIANGVDARIDIYHLKPGTDLPQWMADQITLADKVLLICSKEYVNKADIRNGGVGWETMIIQGDMLVSQNSNKYIAIVRTSDIKDGLPIYMKSKYAISWSTLENDDENFNELIRTIFDIDIAPPIGEIPDFIKLAMA